MDGRDELVIGCQATVDHFCRVYGVTFTALALRRAITCTTFGLFVESARLDRHRLEFIVHALIIIK